MAAHMFDLPEKPGFPVHGLDQKFDGYRWLVIWDDRRLLHTVTLGHGPAKAQHFVSVTTVLKTSERRVDDPHGALVSVGPTGYEGALWGALGELNDDPRWITDQRNAADWADAEPTGPPVNHGPGWVRSEISVEGQRKVAMTRAHGNRVAWLLDLPSVAVSVVGPTLLVPDPLNLAVVTDDLGQYA